MKILTHPDNLKHFKDACEPPSSMYGILRGIEVITNNYMDREKWTGRYVLPDGKVVEPADVMVSWGRFAEWAAEDAPYLLKRGIIRKQMEPLFYEFNDKSLYDMLTVPDFKPLLFSTY